MTSSAFALSITTHEAFHVAAGKSGRARSISEHTTSPRSHDRLCDAHFWRAQLARQHSEARGLGGQCQGVLPLLGTGSSEASVNHNYRRGFRDASSCGPLGSHEKRVSGVGHDAAADYHLAERRSRRTGLIPGPFSRLTISRNPQATTTRELPITMFVAPTAAAIARAILAPPMLDGSIGFA